MNQMTTGKFITKKRKEQNLTQEQLKITIAELMDGEETEEKSVHLVGKNIAG